MASTHAGGSVGVDGARCESHISIDDGNATTLRAWGTKGTKREHPIGAMGRLVVQIASHSLPARAHKSHTQDVSESKHPNGVMGRFEKSSTHILCRVGVDIAVGEGDRATIDVGSTSL